MTRLFLAAAELTPPGARTPTAADLREIQNAVERQLADYNNRNLESFLTHYHVDVEMFRTTVDNRTVQGIEQLRNVYSGLFANSPNLKAVVSKRTINNWEVTDTEHVSGLRDSDKTLNFLVTYYVDPATLKIRKVLLVPQ